MKIVTPENGQEAYHKEGVLGRKLLSKEEEIEIGQERRAVSSGAVVESPKDIPHALHNPGHSPFEVLVVKTPRP
jgi:hypothetical protein